MNRIHLVLFLINLFFASCSEKIDNTGTCSDGIKNQGEQGVDCGGPCQNVCPSCADGIRNQGETAVDCGGPCDPCYPRFAATINNVQWNSTSRSAFISGPGTVRIYGTDQMNNITLNYSGPLSTGTVNTGPKFTGELRDGQGNLYLSAPGGSITFTTFDTLTNTISGTYTFIGINSVNSTSKLVTGGIFNVLTY